MKILTTIIFMVLAVLNIQAKTKKETKPNVLLIYTDDHRYSGIDVLGWQTIGFLIHK